MWGDVLKLAVTVAEYATAAKRRHWPMATLCLLLASGFAVTTAACLIATLWIFLVPQVGPWAAPLIVAGVTLVLSLLLFASGWRLLRRRPTAALPSPAAIEAGLAEVKTLIGEHKGTILLAAAIAGLIFGNRRPRR